MESTKYQKFEDKLISMAGVVARNTVLNVIQHSFMLIFPFMMIGSIFSLITGFPSEAWTGWLASAGLDTILAIPTQYTTEFISVYLVFAICYYFCAEKGNKRDAIVNGLIAIFAFMILVPYGTTGEGWAAVTSIPFTYTGARGMFIAIFVGFIVGGICNFVKKKNWTIKMPDSVPPFIADSFTSLIPAFLVTFAALIVRYAFSFTEGGNVFAVFYSVLQAPLSLVTNGPWGVAIIETVSMLLWWLGIHGGAVTYQIKNILFAEARLGNLAAYAAGETLQYPVTGLFLTVGVMPLVLMCFLVGKSHRMKSVSKIAAVPAIFGISEPINFGLPTVLNPVMLIPSLIIYPISVFYTYALNMLGWLPYCNGAQIRNCPYFILSFIQFGGFKGLFWWIVLFIIACLIYLPFVKALDKQYVAEESGTASENAALVGSNATTNTITVTCAKPEKIVETFDGREVCGVLFSKAAVVEHSVTLEFDETKHNKKEIVKSLKQFFKDDSYYSGLMVQIK